VKEFDLEESAHDRKNIGRIGLATTVRNNKPLEVLSYELLDEGRTVEPEHCRMNGEPLRGFEGEMDSRLHLVSALRFCGFDGGASPGFDAHRFRGWSRHEFKTSVEKDQEEKGRHRDIALTLPSVNGPTAQAEQPKERIRFLSLID